MNRLCLLIGFAALTISGCHLPFGPTIQGSGNRVVEDRPVGNFKSLDVVTPGDFTVSLGSDTPMVAIEVDDNLQPIIRTVMKGESLEIRSRENFSSAEGLVGTIQTDQLEEISVTGSAQVEVYGLSGESCDLSVTGSGDIVANGVVNRVRVEITGSGSIDLRALQSADVEVSITGSGSAIVDASQSLQVSITGSGDVSYVGTPQINQSITGSGRVSALTD